MREFVADPRARLALTAALTTLAVIFNRITAQAALLVAAVILCMIFGRGGIRLLMRLKGLIAFFVLMAVVQSIFHGGGRVLFSLNGTPLLTSWGLELGACFLCRMAVIIFSAGIIAAAGSRAMIQGLVALKLPYELAFMTTCALSFLPLIAADMKDSLVALELRGVEMKKLPLTRKIKIYGYLIIPVLEGVAVKAKELSCAMEMRAFRAYNKRSSYTILSLCAKDYVIIFSVFAAFTASLYFYFR